MSPRVTVILPTYNWSSVLRYAIASVLRQTFTDFELLVIGDGCTDDSEQVATSTGDPRVRWMNLPANTGHQSGPNNEGLRQARGELIGREGSATHGRVMELHAGDARPTFLHIPIGVWHGLQNVGTGDALMLNYPSRAYNYEDPDHYRLPWDSDEIPYRWLRTAGTRLRNDHA